MDRRRLSLLAVLLTSLVTLPACAQKHVAADLMGSAKTAAALNLRLIEIQSASGNPQAYFAAKAKAASRARSTQRAAATVPALAYNALTITPGALTRKQYRTPFRFSDSIYKPNGPPVA